jgi:hypothetical protein
LTSIRGASSAPVEVESISERDAEEPTPLHPRIVEVTRLIKALAMTTQANWDRKRVSERRPIKEKSEGRLSWRRGIPATIEGTSG